MIKLLFVNWMLVGFFLLLFCNFCIVLMGRYLRGDLYKIAVLIIIVWDHSSSQLCCCEGDS